MTTYDLSYCVEPDTEEAEQREFIKTLRRRTMNPTMKDGGLINRLKKLEKQVEPEGMDSEVALLTKGEFVQVSEDDDHDTHIARHQNDRSVIQMKVLRGTVKPIVLTNLEDHIEAHKEMKKKPVDPKKKSKQVPLNQTVNC
jgi:hypothetical protein